MATQLIISKTLFEFNQRKLMTFVCKPAECVNIQHVEKGPYIL